MRKGEREKGRRGSESRLNAEGKNEEPWRRGSGERGEEYLTQGRKDAREKQKGRKLESGKVRRSEINIICGRGILAPISMRHPLLCRRGIPAPTSERDNGKGRTEEWEGPGTSSSVLRTILYLSGSGFTGFKDLQD